MDYIPSKGAGIYSIYCTGADPVTLSYGTVTMFAVPELPLGTVGAVLIPLGALMLYRRKRA